MKQLLIVKLKVVNFGLCIHDQRDSQAIVQMQHLLDEGMHILLFVDRGVNRAARSIFVGDLKTILDCLLPAPKTVCVDASNSFRYENWTSPFALDQTAVVSFNISDSSQLSLLVCKLRKYAYELRQCLYNRGIIGNEVEEDGYDSEARRLDEQDEEEERVTKEKADKEALEAVVKSEAEKKKGRFSLFGGRSSSPDKPGVVGSLSAGLNFFGGRKTPDPTKSSDSPDGKVKDDDTPLLGGFNLFGGGRKSPDPVARSQSPSRSEADYEKSSATGAFSLFGARKPTDATDVKRSTTPSRGRFSIFGGGDKKTPEIDSKYDKDPEVENVVPDNVDFSDNQKQLHLQMKAQAAKAKSNYESIQAKKKEERRTARIAKKAKKEADDKLLKEISVLDEADPQKAAEMRANYEESNSAAQMIADRKADLCLGMTAPAEKYLKSLFEIDLKHLYESVKAAVGDDERSLNGMTFPPAPDVLLATVFCAITGKWKAPLITWRLRDFKNGALTFLEEYSTPQAIFRDVILNPLPISTITDTNRLEQIKRFSYFWDYDRKIDFYLNPVRYLLLKWCLYAIELIGRLAYAGGAALDKQDAKFYSSIKHLEWDNDICNKNVDAFVGILLHGCLKEAEVYESKNDIIQIVNRTDIYDFSRSMKQFRPMKVDSVTVYHYNDDIYICVKVPGVVLR